MSLLTRDLPRNSAELEFVTDHVVEEVETLHWCLALLIFGTAPTHESVLDRILDKYDADVLVDGQLQTTQYGIPYIYMQVSTRAIGRPARFSDRGDR